MSTLGLIKDISGNGTTAFFLIMVLAGIGLARIEEGGK
jgi:hypothetical protein|tara:strand:+ start:1132 stop:1245 length:114 start_codon:yes stop_codon:yes gene_type:complete